MIEVATIKKGRCPAQPGADPFKGVVTASKNTFGNLRLATWGFNHNAGSFSEADEIGLGPVTGHLAVTAVPVGGSREMVVVAARTVDGMRLISLAVNAQGALTKKSERLLGEAKEITLNKVSNGRFLTAMQDKSGRLRLLGWWLGSDGKMIRLGDERSHGAVGRVASAVIDRDGGDTLIALAAMRAANGDLKLISFDSNL